MDTKDKYNTAVAGYRHYLDYMVKMLLIYLAIVGALLKFALDANSTPQLFFTLNTLGILFCLWSFVATQIHYNSTKALHKSMSKYASELECTAHADDVNRLAQLIISLHVFNTIVMVAFIVLICIGHDTVTNGPS